jgi:hypothetical protein
MSRSELMLRGNRRKLCPRVVLTPAKSVSTMHDTTIHPQMELLITDCRAIYLGTKFFKSSLKKVLKREFFL